MRRMSLSKIPDTKPGILNLCRHEMADAKPELTLFEERHRKVDIKLHGKGNSNSHGARPVY